MLEPRDVERYERELRAMVIRAGDEDPEGFAAIVQLLDRAVGAMPAAASLTRKLHGYSWYEIAAGLGVSRQAATARFGAIGSRASVPDLKGIIRAHITYVPDRESSLWPHGRKLPKVGGDDG